MFMKKFLLSISIITVIGCSHTPTVGEQILAQSEDSKTLGEQWKKGEELVIKGRSLEKKGTSLVYDGEKNIRKGKKLMNKGENQIRKGKSLQSDSKRQIKDGLELQKESKQIFTDKFPGKLQ